MTTATFKTDGNAFDVEITGHAEYDKERPDIVCAACSILTYTLLNAMQDMEAEGGLLTYTENDIADGHFHIRGEAASWAQERVQTILDVIATGFALLQEEYPDNVAAFTD